MVSSIAPITLVLAAWTGKFTDKAESTLNESNRAYRLHIGDSAHPWLRNLRKNDDGLTGSFSDVRGERQERTADRLRPPTRF